MRSDSDLRVVADFCAILGLIATALKVFWYCGSARPNETYRSFHTRMEFGEFRWERASDPDEKRSDL